MRLFVVGLVLTSLAILGQSKGPVRKSVVGKRGTEARFGLTQADIKALVDGHNEWRKNAKSGNMQKLDWDDQLATDAMTWANACMFGHGQPEKPAFTTGEVGQNLGYTTRHSAQKNFSFGTWMDESDYYDFSSNQCYYPPCGHYTQAMWHSHEKVGCAHHVCPEIYSPSGDLLDKGAEYLVCNYYPAGNVGGRRPWTPGDPCEACPYCHDKLCITRETCMKDPTKCACMKNCQHCGTQTSDCKCKCPVGTHGDECQYFCRDRKVECAWFSKEKCNDGSRNGKIIYDYCDVLCGKCTPNTDKSWKCEDETYQNTFVKFAGSPQYGYKTQNRKTCAFPFLYNGKYHNKCLKGKNGITWCSKSTNYDRYKTYGTGCRIVKTEGNGADCVFPFIFKGNFYQKCIFDESVKKHWCGTTENYDMDKKWGYCMLDGIH
ncbi:cysteine-rich secretory protein 2-like [Lineus longissimus]|uniref:cysteine-rich secretory protein 2-like n=1 Tax=Lineus longissimus TaxID=88925 RepID=UPI002B4CB81B